MGTVKKADISTRLQYYSRVLSEFQYLYTAQAFILFIIYFGEYLLAKFSKHKNKTENETGANIAKSVGKSVFYRDIINLRNAVTHYDRDDIIDILEILEQLDYNDLSPVTSDDTITQCIMTLANVNWNVVRSYLLSEV